jgi:hypothetical protein
MATPLPTALGRPAPTRFHVAAFALLLVLATVVRFHRIGWLLPYCDHVDERTIVNVALDMRRAGDPNPHRFNYPTLPLYLVLGTFVVGGAVAVASGHAGGLKELDARVGAYYPVPLAAWFARGLFALLSVAALALLGLIGRAVGSEALLWLAPLVAFLPANYFRLSTLYLNVDIVGTFFALSALALVVHAKEEAGAARDAGKAWRRAALWGACCGFTIGSKYNLFPIVLPCILWFWFYERRRFVPLVAVLGAATVLAFLVGTPYAILDHRAFLDGTLREMRHYGLAHPEAGLEGDLLSGRGLPMVATHVEHFAESFGWPGLLVAAVGVYGFARQSAKTAMIVFAYPFALVAYMSLQVLFRERNVVSTELFMALALAQGILTSSAALASWFERRRLPFWLTPRLVYGSSAVVVTAAVLAGVEWYRVLWAYTADWEPRNTAVAWVRARPARPRSLIVDASLHVDLRTLPDGARPRVMSDPSGELAARAPSPGVAIVPRTRAEDYARALNGNVVAEFRRGSRLTADHGLEHEAPAVVVF